MTPTRPKVWTAFVIGTALVVCLAQAQSLPNVHPEQAGQGVAADLDRALAQADPDELIPVVLLLHRQATNAEKKTAARGQGRRLARAAVTRLLREMASQSQRSLARDLAVETGRGRAHAIRPLWLTNAIALRATPELIERLRTRPEVARVIHDPPQPVLLEILAGSDTADVECGVQKVRAPEAWERGYDGAGILVAVLDTGTCWTHSDIATRLWINPGEDLDGDGEVMDADDVNGVDDDGNGYVDDFIGWDMTANDREPGDTNGHGSHVAGTVSGDGTGGFAAGTAPGAEIMTLRVLGDVGASQAHVWEAMQYAVDNGADIISMSLGWRHWMNPDRATWRQSVENVIDAGVTLVVAAGNEGGTGDAPPYNVRTPGDVPRAITVGATGCTDFPAGFSSDGPVTWQDVDPYFDHPYPPGLVKPDIAAPGVNTKSHYRCVGYGFNSGTSMATPHVAGVLAILLSADPSLDHDSLKSLLESTAVDLDPAGKDNKSGWGRIDGIRALNDATGVADLDLDSLPDAGDNCPSVANFCQEDSDGDGLGDVCDPAETFSLSVDVPADLRGDDYESSTVVRVDGTNYTAQQVFPEDVRLSAFHIRSDGGWLFVPAVPVTLGLDDYEPRDIVAFDGANFSPFLRGADAGVPAGVGIDALHLDGSGNPVVSFDLPITDAGAEFLPADLVLLSAGTMTRVWYATGSGVPAGVDLVGAFRDNRDRLIVSFDVPVNLGGIDYLPGELVEARLPGFARVFSDTLWPPYAVLRDASVLTAACRDVDCDGFGAPGDVRCRGGAQVDCDDRNASASPSSMELCDLVDNDCDGLQDEGYEVGAACTAGIGACAQPGLTVCHYTGLFEICDATAGVPGSETCGDGIDNDCDGETDEDDAIDAPTWYADGDGDGHGTGAGTTVSCSAPVGFASDDTDCNDVDPDVWNSPGPVVALIFPDPATLSWSAPLAPGGSVGVMLYDTLRSDTADSFSSATCLETDGGDTSTLVDSVPSPGQAFYYVVRAGNGCGEGSLGSPVGGGERAGPTCF